MTLHPGEVVLIPFPFSDLQAAKRRPVLVLRSCDGFGDFLAAAITSQAGMAPMRAANSSILRFSFFSSFP